MQPCSTPGCAKLVAKGRCKPHAAQHEQARPLWDMRRLYRSSRWRAIRALVLDSQPICQACHRAPSVDVHHRLPHRGNIDQFFDTDHLEGLCHACHSRLTAKGG